MALNVLCLCPCVAVQIYKNSVSTDQRTKTIAKDLLHLTAQVNHSTGEAKKERATMHTGVASSLNGIWDTSTKVYRAQVRPESTCERGRHRVVDIGRAAALRSRCVARCGLHRP